MKELDPLFPKWSNFLSLDKDLSTYSIFCAQFSSVFETFLYKNWKHIFTENVSSKKISEYMIWELNFNWNLAKIAYRLRMFTLKLQRHKSKKLRPWERSHWKADEICNRTQGAHDFDNFFDHIFFQTLCFIINFKDKKISSEIVCTLYSVANFISFPMGPFPRPYLLVFLSLEL